MNRNEVLVCAHSVRDLRDMLAYGREIACQAGDSLGALMVCRKAEGQERARTLEKAYRLAEMYDSSLRCVYSDEPECEMLRQISSLGAQTVVMRREWPIALRLLCTTNDTKIYLYSSAQDAPRTQAALHGI